MPPPIRRYATGTSVPVDRSRTELELLLRKHGATAIGVFTDDLHTVIVCSLAGRMIRHELLYPPGEPNDLLAKAEMRRRWRSLILRVKAKLEAIADGDSSVAEEFLAQTLLSDGRTVLAASREEIAHNYTTGEPPVLRLGK